MALVASFAFRSAGVVGFLVLAWTFGAFETFGAFWPFGAFGAFGDFGGFGDFAEMDGG